VAGLIEWGPTADAAAYTGRSYCGTLCETQAISFPTIEEIKRARRVSPS
jgi:hypothetical protein